MALLFVHAAESVVPVQSVGEAVVPVLEKGPLADLLRKKKVTDRKKCKFNGGKYAPGQVRLSQNFISVTKVMLRTCRKLMQ